MNDQFWDRVVFSNENRITCNGPDKLHSYLHKLQNDKLNIFKRQCRKNDVIVWTAFCVHVKSELVYIKSRLNTF